MNSTPIRWLKLSFGLAIAAGFIWLLVRELNLDLLAQAFTSLTISTALVALLLMATVQGVCIVRWWWMLRILEPKLSLGACVRPYLASVAVNNVLPLRAGDALRVLGFRRQLQSPAMRVLGTLVIERVLDTIVVSIILFLSLLGLSEMTLPRDIIVVVTWLAGASVAVMLTLILALPVLERILHRRHLPERHPVSGQRWLRIVFEQGTYLIKAFSLVRSVPKMISLIGMTAMIWIFEGIIFVVIASTLQVGVSPLAPWLSMAAGTLATAIPSAPGYLGTYDYFATQGFVVYGASLEVAVAIVLIARLTWIPLTIAGLLCYGLPFMFSGLSVRRRKNLGV